MLRSIKLGVLSAAANCGLSAQLLNSDWRRQRLLILCYHGVSLDDEHEWNPALYIEGRQLRQRLQYLQQEDCQVLGLDEALRRLYVGTLPKRAVTMTFDDGLRDFYRIAYPLLKEFRVPATVYLTTYYSKFNRPVFDLMSSYLLWKARGQTLLWPDVLSPVVLDSAGRVAAHAGIKEFALRNRLSAVEKDQLLSSLAERLRIDYEELCCRGLLQIMTPGEIKEIAENGIDIQLHTHRHRVSQKPELFRREIEQNRSCLLAAGGKPAEHFCYPGGLHLPEFPGWLKECGVKTATTCEPGIASRRANPFLLPRLVDSSLLTTTEFNSWVSGLASLLPQRTLPMSYDQLLERDLPQ